MTDDAVQARLDALNEWCDWHEAHPETGPRHAGVPIVPQVRTLLAQVAGLEREHADMLGTIRRNTATLGRVVDERDTARAKVAELERVQVCPNDQTVAHFKCDKCGEEWYDHKQSMAHTNQRLAPKVRELEADLTTARQQLVAAQERIVALEGAIRLIHDQVRPAMVGDAYLSATAEVPVAAVEAAASLLVAPQLEGKAEHP